MKMTGGRGVDTAIEAVGIPATFEMCEQIVAAGGTIANIGVHGKQVALHLERLWDRNIDITTRLVDTVSTPMLLNSLRAHKIDPKLLITHNAYRLLMLEHVDKLAEMSALAISNIKFDKIIDAYETFGHAADTKALKVIIEV